MSQCSYVLRDDIELEYLLAKLSEAAESLHRETGLLFGFTHMEERNPDVRIYTWTDLLHQQSTVSLVIDRDMPARYIQVAARTAKERDLLMGVLARELPIMDVDELQTVARNAENSDGGALARLGVGSPTEFDAVTYELLKAGLSAEDKSVRLGAATAMFLLRWAPLVSSLNRALETETEEDVRRVLDATLTVCRAKES